MAGSTTTYEGEPISSSDDMAAEGDFQYKLQDCVMNREAVIAVLSYNAANPTNQKPVPDIKPRPPVPPRDIPRPGPTPPSVPAPIEPIPIYA